MIHGLIAWLITLMITSASACFTPECCAYLGQTSNRRNSCVSEHVHIRPYGGAASGNICVGTVAATTAIYFGFGICGTSAVCKVGGCVTASTCACHSYAKATQQLVVNHSLVQQAATVAPSGSLYGPATTPTPIPMIPAVAQTNVNNSVSENHS